MNYKKIRKTLSALNDLLLEIESKERERKLAIKFNKKNHFIELAFDIPELYEELLELQIEYQREKRNL